MKNKTLKFAITAIICTALTGLCTINVSAQTESGSGHFTDIRIFGGINYGAIVEEGQDLVVIDSVNHTKSIDVQAGGQFGASLTFGNHWYISPGFWYSTYTYDTKFTIDDQNNTVVNGNDINFENETTVSSIAVPVRLGFRFVNPHTENIFNLRLYGGVTGNHVMSVKNKGDKNVELSEDDFQKLYLDATAGLGVDVLFLFLDAGYDLGLTDFEKTKQKTRRNSFFLNLGVKFKI